jgi:hypothetical protein
VALGECPTGSRCTVSGSVNEHDNDGEGTKFAFVTASIYLANENAAFRDGGDCENARFTGTQEVATHHCVLRPSAVRLGPEADRAVCLGLMEARGAEFAGSDDSRYVTCAASMTVEPADGLEASTVSGNLVQINVPAAGLLAASAVPAHARAVAAAISSATRLALVAPSSARATQPGPVTLRLKLTRRARTLLRRRHRLTVPMLMRFTPAVGTARLSRTVRLTFRQPPKRPRGVPPTPTPRARR